MNAYPEPVWQHFRAPRRAGRWEAGEGRVTGDADTPAGRARIRLELRIAGDTVEDAVFQALGCPCTIAAGSWLAEQVVGRHLDELDALDSAIIVERLQLPAVKRYCAVMAEDALRAAISSINRNEL